MFMFLAVFGGQLAFGAPFQVTAAGKAITVGVGHAAPLLADIDGDGKAELLVGQFEGGKIRVYRDHGTDAHVFSDFSYLKAGGKEVSVDFG